MYADERVARLISESFISARVHVKDQAEDFARLGERFGAQWTPTIVMLDENGVERHRIEGFLPVEDFLAHLELGLARIAFFGGAFDEAQRRFDQLAQRYPESELAPEGVYWSGVSRYKATNDAGALAQTAKAFEKRYQRSPWAKKASVWAA